MSETKADIDGAALLAQEFLRAFTQGQLCLHPTDTVPGLTFDPRNDAAKARLARFKGRDPDKPCLGLVADLETALRCYAPLPSPWTGALSRLWPGPLSVVWRASACAPRALVAADATIGLRVPALAPEHAWFALVLRELRIPLPTTSINRSGESPILDWEVAQQLLEGHAYRPPRHDAAHVQAPELAGRPSTVIRIADKGRYEILRAGTVTSDTIDAMLREVAT